VVAGKWAAGGIGTVLAWSQANHQQRGLGIAKWWHGLAEILRIIGPHKFKVVNESRTPPAKRVMPFVHHIDHVCLDREVNWEKERLLPPGARTKIAASCERPLFSPMKISASDVRVGNLLEYQGKLWRVLKKNHVKPGKGGAFAQLEMKEIHDGTKLNERFRSEDKLEKAHVEPRQMQYLYLDGESYIFMDLETYEQIQLTSEDLTGQAGYLLPNVEIQINFHNGNPIGIELPATVTLEIADTESVVKGQTAASSAKPAIVETGLRVMVPPFVSVGDRVRVNTDTGEYMERADN